MKRNRKYHWCDLWRCPDRAGLIASARDPYQSVERPIVETIQRLENGQDYFTIRQDPRLGPKLGLCGHHLLEHGKKLVNLDVLTMGAFLTLVLNKFDLASKKLKRLLRGLDYLQQGRFEFGQKLRKKILTQFYKRFPKDFRFYFLDQSVRS